MWREAAAADGGWGRLEGPAADCSCHPLSLQFGFMGVIKRICSQEFKLNFCSCNPTCPDFPIPVGDTLTSCGTSQTFPFLCIQQLRPRDLSFSWVWRGTSKVQGTCSETSDQTNTHTHRIRLWFWLWNYRREVFVECYQTISPIFSIVDSILLLMCFSLPPHQPSPSSQVCVKSAFFLKFLGCSF